MDNAAKKSKSLFSPWQLIVLTITAGMGGMYFYPDSFSRSSLIILVCVGVLTLISMAMLAYAFRRSESRSFPNLMEEVFGSVAARIILAAAAVYFAAEICTITVKQTQMTSLFLLETTPSQVIIAVSLLASAFIMYSGIKQISRTAELLFFFIMIPLTFILLLALPEVDYGELLPLLSPNGVSADRIYDALLPLGGIAAVICFVGYYDKNKNVRSLTCGALVLLVYAAVILLCCAGVFSIGGVAHLAFPLAELSRLSSLGSLSLTERFDIIYMIVYTSASLISSGILYYCCCISLCGLFGIKSHRCFIFLLLPLLFILSWYGLSNAELIEMIAVWGKLIFLFVLIPILFIASLIKSKRRV